MNDYRTHALRGFALACCFLGPTACTRAPGPPATTTTGSSPSTQPPSPCVADSGGGEQGARAQLTDVSVASLPGKDRVTFTFEQGSTVPRFQLSSASPPFHQDPSDEPMDVEGSSFMRVVFHGASGVDLSSSGVRKTYTGPVSLKPRLKVVQDVEQEGDFESTLTWDIGLSRPSCWAADLLTDPARVIIDLPH